MITSLLLAYKSVRTLSPGGAGLCQPHPALLDPFHGSDRDGSRALTAPASPATVALFIAEIMVILFQTDSCYRTQ